MTNVETTLIIFLSVGLGILLLLSIIVVFIFIQILQNIHRITQKAEATTENLGEVVKAFGKKIAPLAFTTIITALMKRVTKRRKSGEE